MIEGDGKLDGCVLHLDAAMNALISLSGGDCCDTIARRSHTTSLINSGNVGIRGFPLDVSGQVTRMQPGILLLSNDQLHLITAAVQNSLFRQHR